MFCARFYPAESDMYSRRRCLGTLIFALAITLVTVLFFQGQRREESIASHERSILLRSLLSPPDAPQEPQTLDNVSQLSIDVDVAEARESEDDLYDAPLGEEDYKNMVVLNNTLHNLQSTRFLQMQRQRQTAVDMKTLTKRFPTFIIVGFGKTGTKALYEVLKLHPHLRGPFREERFFSLHYSDGIGAYLRSFSDPPQNGFTIEKSPDYIISQQAPTRILESASSLGVDASKMKFIVVLRDPIDRSMSEYMEWNINRRFSRSQLLPKFHNMVLNRDGTVDSSQYFLNTSMYAHHIKNWLKVFPREQMCYVDGEKFVSDPYQEVHQLEKCIGLRRFFKPTNFVFNPARGFYCFRVRKFEFCMNKSKGRKHPDIPSEVTEKLKNFFRPWNEQLQTLAGRELTNWDSVSKSPV